MPRCSSPHPVTLVDDYYTLKNDQRVCYVCVCMCVCMCVCVRVCVHVRVHVHVHVHVHICVRVSVFMITLCTFVHVPGHECVNSGNTMPHLFTPSS